MEPQQQIKLDLINSLKDDLSKQKSILEQLLHDERKYSEDLENRIQQMNSDYSVILQRSENSAQSFITKINSLVSESESLQKENLDLKLKLKEKEDQIFYLEENLNKFKLCNFNGLAEEYKKRIEEISELYSKCDKDRENLQKILKGSNDQPEIIIKNQSVVELEDINKNLCKTIKDLNDEIKFYKMQQMEIKLENTVLREKNQEYEKSINELMTYTKGIEVESTNLKEKFQSTTQKLEKIAEEAETFKSDKENLSNELKNVQSQKEKLEKEMDEFKCKVMHSAKLERSNIDDVDLALEKYFADQGLENLFVKFSTGLYVYGTRKVNVSLKNGNIVCRVNGNYYLIEEFLKIDKPEKKVTRTVLGSPVNSRNKAFNFTASHNKTSSLVSHLVSPSNKARLRLSFDFENDKVLHGDKKKTFKIKTLNGSEI